MSNGLRKLKSKYGELWVRGGYLDYQSVFLLILIVLFGFLMLYSASSYKATLQGLSSTYYLKHQVIVSGGGLVVMWFISHINYRYYQLVSKFAMMFAIFLSGIVFILGTATKGAVRWIQIGGQQFQPSELAKPAIIIFMAHCCIMQPKRLNDLKGMISIMIMPAICIVLIAIENLSTAIICFLITVVIVFVASPKAWKLIGIGLIGVAGAAIMVMAESYRGSRFDAWLHPETSPDGYQTMQSLYAIGSGGLFGKGLGQSMQKLGFLPEAHNDMIFSIICEELGLFGAIGVIVLFLMLLFRFKYIAECSSDGFGGLIVTGVLAHIALQMGVNIAVVTNTIPNTGVTLPFISFGGTSLIAMMAEVGLVLSVSRLSRLEKEQL